VHDLAEGRGEMGESLLQRDSAGIRMIDRQDFP